MRPERPHELCVRHVLLVGVGGQVHFLGRGAQHTLVLRILQNSVGDAVPLLSGCLVGEPSGHIVQALSSGLELPLSSQLRFKSVTCYVQS